MSAQESAQPGALEAPSPEKTLRQLFLTLFLRGRSSRGLQKSAAPNSIGTKLAFVLFLYAAFGLAALIFWRHSIFDLSAWLHAMTFVFLGMFIAASSGEMLFNKEEADILLHRPVPPRAMLWAKVRVLVEVSLWLAGALNLVSFIVGMFMPRGSWLFPFAHALSITLEALFTAGCVVVIYQLCLRWFGRERLDNLMTTAQVLVAIGAALAGQILPQMIGSFAGGADFGLKTWWLGLLPPVWFAALDDALVGDGGLGSWALAALGILATTAVLGIAFGKLARDYERGLQILGESAATPRRAKAGRRWFDVMVSRPPLSWWMRDSVARAAFLLTAAYLVRDRDMKLRVYPSLAPMMVMPLMSLLRSRNEPSGFSGGFNAVLLGIFAGLITPLALSAVRYSQQWKASDVFRAAPIPGPAQLCHGARRAVLLVVTLPLLVLFAIIAWFSSAQIADLALMLPGLVLVPILALAPSVRGRNVPLSQSSEAAAAVLANSQRVLNGLALFLTPFFVSGLGAVAMYVGWFWWYIGVETLVVLVIYASLRIHMASLRWPPLE